VALAWELSYLWRWSGLYKIFDVLISLGFYSIRRAVGCGNSISKDGFGSFATAERAGWN
jgi:nucleoid DNA-binding protein